MTRPEDREPDANWERLAEIRDRIVANRENFSMRQFFTDARGYKIYNLDHRNAPLTSAAGEVEWCGTSCCVAGFAVIMFPNDQRMAVGEGKFAFFGDPSDAGVCAANLLGITYHRAYVIFAGFVDHGYTVRDDDGGVPYTVYHGWSEETPEGLTLLYIDALLKRRAFVYPHECEELHEVVGFTRVSEDEP